MRTHVVTTRTFGFRNLRRLAASLIASFVILSAVILGTVILSTPAHGAEPKHILLLGQGPDGHPAGTHEYVAGLEILGRILKSQPELEVQFERADEPWTAGRELLEKADGAVLYLAEGAKWLQADPRRLEAFKKLAERHGGLVCLHWAMGTKDAAYIDGFVKLFGGCHGGPDRHFQVLETNVSAGTTSHPINRGVAAFRVREEFYYRLKFVPEGKIIPILQARIDEQDETVAWAWQRPDGGRSFGYSGMHFVENWQRPECVRLIANAVLWSVDQPIPDTGVPLK